MNSFKLAMLQLLPCGNIEDNLKKGLDYCKLAKDMGADMALFPEMWSTGYLIPQDSKKLSHIAVPLDGEFTAAFKNLAKEIGIAIGITILEKHEPHPRNTLCIFDRYGENILSYSKVHTCDFGEERMLDSGEDFYVADLDTEHGILKVGAMICYDREFPESARVLMLKGAEIIFVPNACPMEINRLSQLRARAYENMIGIATVNYPSGHPDCNGHSSAFDGIAYKPSDEGSRDTLIIEAGEREGIYIADFPVKEIREYRKSEIHGNAYRRPEKYKILTSETINEPFIRSDRRK